MYRMSGSKTLPKAWKHCEIGRCSQQVAPHRRFRYVVGVCVACICRFRFIHRVDVQYSRRLRLYINMSKADRAIRTINTASVTRHLPSSGFHRYLESCFHLILAVYVSEEHSDMQHLWNRLLFSQSPKTFFF